MPQGGPFQKPPANHATIQVGSGTVFINGKPAARNGDPALTCNDPADLPVRNGDGGWNCIYWRMRSGETVADRHLLTDIRLRLKRSELRPVYTVATGERRVPKLGARLDLATTTIGQRQSGAGRRPASADPTAANWRRWAIPRTARAFTS